MTLMVRSYTSKTMSSTRLEIDHRLPAARHPEKQHRPDNPISRKPDWIRVRAPSHPIYHETPGADAREEPRHRLRGSGLPRTSANAGRSATPP